MMTKQNCSLLRALCLMLAALLLCGTALAEPRYPDKTADATDAALLLSADTLKDWNELATRVKSATGVRLYLATVDFLDGASLADYGAGLRSKWGLDDDSLLLLMAAGEDAFGLFGGASVNKASITNVIIGTILYQGLVTMTPTVMNAIVHLDISEVIRIIVSNGMIVYALTRKTEGGK